MGIFKKNPNEILYQGGKKHIIDVLKNSAPGYVLVWRQPEEDFNYNSTLIVMPGESAIFVKNGKIECIFDEPGRYLLNSQNYPFLSRITNSFSGGISTYNSVVYFIRTAVSQEINWGTMSPISVRDKVWGIVTEVRAFGSYKVRITNPAQLLIRMLGNNVQFETQDGLYDYFGNEFQSKIKSIISKNLNEMETEIIGIEHMMDDISSQIAPKLDHILQEYGLTCMAFNIASLNVDKSDYDSFDKSQVDMYTKKMEAMGELAQMQVLGDNWDKVKQYGILKDMVNNPNQANGLGMGMLGAEIGVGAAAGSMLGKMANDVFQTTQSSSPQSGQGAQAAAGDPFEVLSKLQKMYEMGLIEKSEYDAKKAEVLARL